MPRRGRKVARELVAMTGMIGLLAVLIGAVMPGAALRSDLVAGADALRALPPSAPRRDVVNALHAAFGGRAVNIDTAAFPVAVEVTFRAVDRQTCEAVASSAHRLEGDVVVELAGYDAPGDCRDANAMTWRLMP